MKKNSKNYIVIKNAEDLGAALGLSQSDTALMKYKARLTTLAVRAIESSELTVNEIVKRSGIARSKVSAVKNGATVNVTCDLLVKIIAAAGLEMAPPKAA